MSPFAERTFTNAVDLSLFGILLPIFIIGILVGKMGKSWRGKRGAKRGDNKNGDWFEKSQTFDVFKC